jgi:homospermidine synthase
LPRDMFVPGGRTRTFGVVNAPGFEVIAKTITPMGGLVEGYVVRHDESFTISRSLTSGDYSPSVYYVYQPSSLTVDSVEELRRTGRPVDSYRLMTEEIQEGRDEVGVSLFCRGGSGLFVGSLLDIEEARELFDGKMSKYVNATINQVMGGYVSGIVYLLSGARGLLDPEDVPVDLVWQWGSMFWGPVVMMPFESPFASNRVQDMGLVIRRRYKY